MTIEIRYLQDLDNMRNVLDGDYILLNSLDFNDDNSYDSQDTDWATKKTLWTTGNGWTPIGDAGSGFTGSFDGQNNSISNLKINRAITHVGLFGILSGDISNLGLVDVDLAGSGSTGGFAGRQAGGTISSSFSTGTISGGNYTGGLVGILIAGVVSDSYSVANIQGAAVVGGLLGGSLNVGLIVVNCYSAGSVTGSAAVGGLIGQNNGSASNSFWDTQTSGQLTSAGGTGKTTAEMMEIETFLNAGWDITKYLEEERIIKNNYFTSKQEFLLQGAHEIKNEEFNLTDRGNRKSTHRTRQHEEYIENPENTEKW